VCPSLCCCCCCCCCWLALLQGGFPDLRVMLCIGGIDMRSQMDVLKRGVHIVVATPGRLKDLLTKRRMNLDICRCGARQAARLL
jgi:superfamily II DNA/RNA helicase